MKRVLVIGDAIADVYRHCTFKKMCPDADNVKAVVTERVEILPGGAANVAVNLTALAPDVIVDLIAVTDIDLTRAIKNCSFNRVDVSLCQLAEVGRSVTKERIISDGEFVLRIDNKSDASAFAGAISEILAQYLLRNDPDLILVSDYAGGTLNEKSWAELLKFKDKLMVDTKQTDLSMFSRKNEKTFLIKLNQNEWAAALIKDHSPERNFQATIVTKGSDGADLHLHSYGPGISIAHTLSVKGIDVDVIDVCGCGDTFFAGLAASLLINSDIFTALQFANAAASTVVVKNKTAIADRNKTFELVGREV